MLGVHLYLAKAFGCLVAQSDTLVAKLDLPGIGDAIRNERAFSSLYIDIGTPGRISKGPIVSASNPELYLNPHDGSCGLATWFYNVNGVCALVSYAPEMREWAHAKGLWHPSFGMTQITVKDFTLGS